MIVKGYLQLGEARYAMESEIEMTASTYEDTFLIVRDLMESLQERILKDAKENGLC